MTGFNNKNVSLFKGYINLMDVIKHNLVFQMDREAPLTKHNWMCELSSSPRTKQLPSLHYKEELISILTSPLLIHWHILSSCHYTNTLRSFWDISMWWCWRRNYLKNIQLSGEKKNSAYIFVLRVKSCLSKKIIKSAVISGRFSRYQD